MVVGPPHFGWCGFPPSSLIGGAALVGVAFPFLFGVVLFSTPKWWCVVLLNGAVSSSSALVGGVALGGSAAFPSFFVGGVAFSCWVRTVTGPLVQKDSREAQTRHWSGLWPRPAAMIPREDPQCRGNLAVRGQFQVAWLASSRGLKCSSHAGASARGHRGVTVSGASREVMQVGAFNKVHTGGEKDGATEEGRM